MADSRPDSDFKYPHKWSENGLECVDCLNTIVEIRARSQSRRACHVLTINQPHQPIGMIIKLY